MSLKNFHIVFIIAALLIHVYLGVWCFWRLSAGKETQWAGLLWVCVGMLLLISGYFVWFLKKSKSVR